MTEIIEEKMVVLYDSDNGKRRKSVKVKCHKCGETFWRAKRSIDRLKGNAYCSDECKFSDKRTKVKCSYCDKEFIKQKSNLKNSKSGLYFCCREHKDLAQRIENNTPEIWADHYGNAKATYREQARRNYDHSCECCGYDNLDICEVHHIDENRNNNKLKNLVILCPNCHVSIHKGFISIIESRKFVCKLLWRNW